MLPPQRGQILQQRVVQRLALIQPRMDAAAQLHALQPIQNEQRALDAPIHPHLVVDRLAGSLELLLMLVLGRIEQLADDTVVKVDDFISDGGHALDGQCYQGGVTPLRLELGQVGGRHLAAFAGDLEQAVLVYLPFDASR